MTTAGTSNPSKAQIISLKVTRCVKNYTPVKLSTVPKKILKKEIFIRDDVMCKKLHINK